MTHTTLHSSMLFILSTILHRITHAKTFIKNETTTPVTSATLDIKLLHCSWQESLVHLSVLLDFVVAHQIKGVQNFITSTISVKYNNSFKLPNTMYPFFTWLNLTKSPTSFKNLSVLNFSTNNACTWICKLSIKFFFLARQRAAAAQFLSRWRWIFNFWSLGRTRSNSRFMSVLVGKFWGGGFRAFFRGFFGLPFFVYFISKVGGWAARTARMRKVLEIVGF